jgi:glucose uptake protein GlcU
VLTVRNLLVLKVFPDGVNDRLILFLIVIGITIIQYLVYLVLLKVYVGGYYFFFMEDEGDQNTSDNLLVSMSFSFLVFVVSGVIYLLYSEIYPKDYAVFLMGVDNNGVKAISQIVPVVLGFIQGSITYMIFRKSIIEKKLWKRFLRLLTLQLIFTVVHFPGLVSFIKA